MNTHTRTQSPLPLRPILIGLGVGVVSATLMLLVFALLIYKLSLPDGVVTPLALTAIGIGSAAGGFAAGLCSGKRGWLMGGVCGTLLYLILLLAGLFRAGGMAVGYAAVKWAVCTVCSAAGGVWGVNRR